MPSGPNFYFLWRQMADSVPVLFAEETNIQLVAYTIKLYLIASTLPMYTTIPWHWLLPCIWTPVLFLLVLTFQMSSV